ncbi:MAG: polyprenol monophosphomannose synthase [Kiritimatiellae bacterium]|nr:polyprenol monophosphomannose synthase [Kiritimatiellia bacterium]
MISFVVVPTYNERENAPLMAKAILDDAPDDLRVLFVDDNSPDGTAAAIEELIPKYFGKLFILKREKKEGLGRAYIAGFRRAIELGAQKIVQMDCDFSHDPKDLPRLLESDADLTIGSRYVKGGDTPGWPFKRRLISRAGGIFIRVVTGMPIKDPTGGFKVWKREALEKIEFETVKSAGYSFQLEMNHRAWKNQLKIVELPIIFRDRTRGTSKINASIAFESLKIAFRLAFE